MNMTDKVEIKTPAPIGDRASMSNAEIASLISNAVAEALKVAIPAAAVGINAANAQATQKDRERTIREVQRRTQRCPICLLPQSACGGPYAKGADGNDIVNKDKDGSPIYSPEVNHARAFCGPRDESMFKWFQGVIVNGVRFLADYPGHIQWIPKKSDILTTINAWEKNEKELSQKREAQGHGAGAVGPNGELMSRGNQNAIGWR